MAEAEVKSESYDVSGSDYRRLPGPSAADALDRLLAAVVGAGHPNHHDAVAIAVEKADEADVRSALRRLLAHHVHDLTDTEASIAVRNLRVGDVIRVHGFSLTIRDLDATKRTVSIRGTLYGARDDDVVRTFAYDRNVHVPLLRRGGR